MYSVYFNGENVVNSITYLGALWKMRKVPCKKGTKVKIEQNKVILEYTKG